VFGDTSNTDKALKQFLRFRILNSVVLLLHLYKSQKSIFMKRLCLFVACFLLATASFAQAKNSGLGFNYQAVIRGADGFVLPKQSVELRFSLMPGQTATQASWIETHKVTTDSYGMIGVIVGKGNKVNDVGVKAQFADVDFSTAHYLLKVEIKESSEYRVLSEAALPSVPYAELSTQTKDIGIPPGTVMAFAGDASKVPAGWLLCDGKAVSRSDYAALYNVIGTAWGFGDNSTTFNLPDMRGMFLRGVSGDSGKDADTSKRVPLKAGGNNGNDVGSYQGDAIRNITGEIISTAPVGAFYRLSNDLVGFAAGYNFNFGWGRMAFDASHVVPVGSDNRPQNVYVNYIIKY